MEKLRPLLLLFSSESAFTVQECANKSETKLADATWNKRKVMLYYLPITFTSGRDLGEEIKLEWPLLCKLWMKECENCRGKKPQQVNVFTNFLLGPDSAMQYPKMYQFIKVLITAQSNTYCVERGYSSFKMICAPQRNRLTPEHLETLFLPATLRILVEKQMNMTPKPGFWKICWRIRHFSRSCSLVFVQYLGCPLSFHFNPPIMSSKHSYLGHAQNSLTVVKLWLIIIWSTYFISSLLLFSSRTSSGFHPIFTTDNLVKCEHIFEK